MDATPTELADLLAEIEAVPNNGATRLRAAVIANRLAQSEGDPWMADVAEAIAEEDVPGATRSLRDSLREQAELSGRVRRAIASGHRVDEISAEQNEAALAAGA